MNYLELENRIKALEGQLHVLYLEKLTQEAQQQSQMGSITEMEGYFSHQNNKTRLRQRAEDQLSKTNTNECVIISETEKLKMIHELEVHHMELEMQNEELLWAKSQDEIATKRYAALYDSAPFGYLTLSPTGCIVEINISAAQLLGKERSQLTNSLLGFFVSEETRPTFNLFLEKVFSSNTKGYCEVVVISEDTTRKEVHLEGLLSEDNEHCMVNAVDITEYKRAKAALILANRQMTIKNEDMAIQANELIDSNKRLVQLLQLNTDKDRFISILAHDLKSPFNIIQGYSNLLSCNIAKYNSDEIENHSKRINDAANKAYHLLESILTWINAQSGKLNFQPQKQALSSICQEVITTLDPLANIKSISISMDTLEDIEIFADRNMITTVLRNLVSNAIKFTNYEGKIEISAVGNTTEVTITVSDNGIGIEQEAKTKLFEISGMETTIGTCGECGSGLGLLLCKEFINKHGGKIWVESQYNKGSQFKFSLPYNQQD